MKNIQTWIILAMAVVIVLIILFDKDPEPNHEAEEQLKVALAIADQQIDSLTKSNMGTLQRIAEDSIIQAEERESFKTQIKAISKRQDTRRPQVLQQIDSLPIVKAFIETQDSTIAIQSARIDSLESDKAELRVNIREITANFEAQLSATQIKLKATEDLAAAYKKQNRKEVRKRRIATALIPVAFVGAFLLSQ